MAVCARKYESWARVCVYIYRLPIVCDTIEDTRTLTASGVRLEGCVPSEGELRDATDRLLDSGRRGAVRVRVGGEQLELGVKHGECEWRVEE